MDERSCSQRRSAQVFLSRYEQTAGVSKEIPRRTKSQERAARRIEENRKGKRNVDASLWRERRGTQPSGRSCGSFEGKVKQYFRALIGGFTGSQSTKCLSKLAVSTSADSP